MFSFECVFHSALMFYKKIVQYAYCPSGFAIKSVCHFYIKLWHKTDVIKWNSFTSQTSCIGMIKSIKLYTQITVFTVFKAYL
jgi:hypothetical protein